MKTTLRLTSLLLLLTTASGCAPTVASKEGSITTEVVVTWESPAGVVLDPKLAGDTAAEPNLPLRLTVQTAEADTCEARVWAVLPGFSDPHILFEGPIEPDQGGWQVQGGQSRLELTFRGRDADLRPADPGPGQLLSQITCESGAAGGAALPVHIVRLGLVAAEGQVAAGNAIPLAYHKRDLDTPEVVPIDGPLIERNAPEIGISDLDNDLGEPLPIPTLWPSAQFAPEVPPYNLPMGVVAGATPELVLHWGEAATSALSPHRVAAFGENPEEWLHVRLVADPDSGIESVAEERVAPGGSSRATLRPTETTMGREDYTLRLRFEASDPSGTFYRVPGSEAVTIRVYKLAGESALRDGSAEGYAPNIPWVGVLEETAEAMQDVPAEVGPVLDALRDHLHLHPYVLYDPNVGTYTEYDGSYIYWENITADLTSFLDHSRGLSLYCHSMSCMLSTLAGHHGVFAEQIVLGVGFRTHLVRAAGSEDWLTWGFNSHSIASPDGGDTLWDASVDMDGDEDPDSEPVVPLAPKGLAYEDYLDRLTDDPIGIVNQGQCYFE